MSKLGLPLKARYRISGDVFTHKEGLRSFKRPMTTSVQVGRRAACSGLGRVFVRLLIFSE